MKLVAFQPSNRWDSLKRNAILLITLGIVIMFGVLLFTLPISSMRALSSVGRKLSAISKKTIEIGVNASTKAIESSSRTIKTVGEVATTGMINISEKATDMIEFITDMIQGMYRSYGKIVHFTVTSTQELVKIVSKASEFVLENMARVSRSTVSAVKSGFEAVMKTIMKTQEMMSDAIQYCFVPAMENFLKTTYGMAQVGVKIYTRYLPALVRYMYFFTKVAISTSVGNASSDVYLSFISLFVSIFSKTVSLTQTNLTDITTTIVQGVADIIPKFLESFDAQTENLCEYLVSAFGGGDIFPSLPVLDLDECSSEAIAVGIRWMTKRVICKDFKYVVEFSDCVFNHIENISLFDGFDLTLSGREIFSFAGISLGGVSYLDRLLGRVGSVSISIPQFSLSSLVSNLKSLVLTLMQRLENYLIQQSDSQNKVIFRIVKLSNSDTDLATYIFQLLYKIILEAAAELSRAITRIIDAVPVCDAVDVSVDIRYCRDVCKWVLFPVGKYVCDKVCSTTTYYLLGQLGIGCSTVESRYKNAILSRLGFLSGYENPLLSLVLGTYKSVGEGSW